MRREGAIEVPKKARLNKHCLRVHMRAGHRELRTSLEKVPERRLACVSRGKRTRETGERGRGGRRERGERGGGREGGRETVNTKEDELREYQPFFLLQPLNGLLHT